LPKIPSISITSLTYNNLDVISIEGIVFLTTAVYGSHDELFQRAQAERCPIMGV
jgi:hypothetical protein